MRTIDINIEKADIIDWIAEDAHEYDEFEDMDVEEVYLMHVEYDSHLNNVTATFKYRLKGDPVA